MSNKPKKVYEGIHHLLTKASRWENRPSIDEGGKIQSDPILFYEYNANVNSATEKLNIHFKITAMDKAEKIDQNNPYDSYVVNMCFLTVYEIGELSIKKVNEFSENQAHSEIIGLLNEKVEQEIKSMGFKSEGQEFLASLTDEQVETLNTKKVLFVKEPEYIQKQ